MTTVTVESELQYEASTRMRQAVFAGVAAVLLIAAPLIGLSGVHANVEELTLDLITIHKRYPLDLIASVIQALGLVALAVTLGWLARLTAFRNPELKPWIRWLAIVGALLFATGVIGNEIVASIAAHKFVSTGNQTYMQANDLTSGGLIAALPLIEQLGALMLTGGFIFISLNSMRVGLLTRYMGYIGIIGGALVLFPLVPVPVVQCFWLGALAVLFAGRWPTGTPPAWASGAAVPWPTTSEPRSGAGRGARGAGAAGGGRTTPERGRGRGAAQANADAAPDAAATPARTRATTPKRKRKRRH
jgi:hypothetical protein